MMGTDAAVLAAFEHLRTEVEIFAFLAVMTVCCAIVLAGVYDIASVRRRGKAQFGLLKMLMGGIPFVACTLRVVFVLLALPSPTGNTAAAAGPDGGSRTVADSTEGSNARETGTGGRTGSSATSGTTSGTTSKPPLDGGPADTGGSSTARAEPQSELDRLLSLLEADLPVRRIEASERLAEMKVDLERVDDVVDFLVSRLPDEDHEIVRRNLIRALGNLDAEAAMETLADAVDDESVFVRTEAIRALGEVGTSEAAELIAPRLADGFDRGDAVEALKRIGPPAEAATLQMLLHEDVFTAMEACEVLKEIATLESLSGLQQVAASDRFPVNHRAGEALEALRNRNGGTLPENPFVSGSPSSEDLVDDLVDQTDELMQRLQDAAESDDPSEFAREVARETERVFREFEFQMRGLSSTDNVEEVRPIPDDVELTQGQMLKMPYGERAIDVQVISTTSDGVRVAFSDGTIQVVPRNLLGYVPVDLSEIELPAYEVLQHSTVDGMISAHVMVRPEEGLPTEAQLVGIWHELRDRAGSSPRLYFYVEGMEVGRPPLATAVPRGEENVFLRTFPERAPRN